MFRLNTIDLDFALAVRAALGRVSSYVVSLCCHPVKKSKRLNYALRCGDRKLCDRLMADTNKKLTLPHLSSDDEKKAFIIGLMDSEGFVAENTQNKTGRAYYMGFKSCDVWVPDFILLLQSVGVKVGKISACPPLKAGYKVPTRFHIKMQSWVDVGLRFNIARKQTRVDRWAATIPYSERSRYPRKVTPETLCQTPGSLG